MKNFSLKIILILSLIVFSLLFYSCSSNKTTSTPDDATNSPNYEQDDPSDNGISFEEEDENANIELSKHDISDFYGSWEATSGKSYYLYGGITLNINNDYSWRGIIGDIEETGKWTKKQKGIELTNKFYKFQLVFTTDDVLILREIRDEDNNPDGEYLNTVLKRK